MFTFNAEAKDNNFEQFIITPYSKSKDTSKYGGVIYFQDSFKDMKQNYICEQRKTNAKQLHMIDQEGGLVVRIHDENAIPPEPDKAVSNGINLFTNEVNKAAKTLNKKYCINTNLAPVADINYNSKSYNRAYSDKPEVANLYSQIFATAMRNNNIKPTWKHFPGYSNNSSPLDITDKKHFKYYKKGFTEGVIDSSSKEQIFKNMLAFKNNYHDLLMINYGIFDKISDEPILFTQEIIDKARELQPNSLIITDDISYLNLTDKKIIYLFKNVDLFIFTDYQDTLVFKHRLEELNKKGLISDKQITKKSFNIQKWITQVN